MEKSTLPAKEPRIIHLGGKSKTRPKDKENVPLRSVYSQNDNQSAFDTPYSITKPIVIRYIDPRIVPLFVQLGKISKMVEHIANNSPENTSTQNKEQLETLIRSTKEINDQVCVIMQENSVSYSSGFSKILNKPEQVRSEYQYLQNKPNAADQSASLNLSEDQIDMVAVLEKVSQRMIELEEQNQRLKAKLQSEIQKSTKLQSQKTQLQSQLRQRETRVQSQISQIQSQLSPLEQKESHISVSNAKKSQSPKP